MSTDFRKPEIIRLARAEGKVTVEGLAQKFGVTTQTIRRDLAELTDEGPLKRVHGGAILASGVVNVDYEQRREINQTGKTLIGQACAQAIPANSSTFINIGTSTEAVARALISHEELLVVTNSLNIANILSANDACDIVVAGGTLRRADGGLLGNLSKQVMNLFKFDYAVISCAGIDEDGDLLDFDFNEVEATQSIIQHSKRKYVVADNTKIHRSAPGRIGSLRDVDILFTDAPLPDDLAEKCSHWNTQVVICQRDQI